MPLATSTLASTSPASTPQFSFFVTLQDVAQDHLKKVTSLDNGFRERYHFLPQPFDLLTSNSMKGNGHLIWLTGQLSLQSTSRRDIENKSHTSKYIRPILRTLTLSPSCLLSLLLFLPTYIYTPPWDTRRRCAVVSSLTALHRTLKKNWQKG